MVNDIFYCSHFQSSDIQYLKQDTTNINCYNSPDFSITIICNFLRKVTGIKEKFQQVTLNDWMYSIKNCFSFCIKWKQNCITCNIIVHSLYICKSSNQIKLEQNPMDYLNVQVRYEKYKVECRMHFHHSPEPPRQPTIQVFSHIK